ncbi:hypothetical protein CSAL01_00566 [Colletotrichum salicis]|uniref:Uncharacterized protein n=1 Tax=Colletotrichum salicis TaxID=1209931 RepID=A0A135UPT3_9PEZI|nr:hypothetical protein CSAL01_00566 [Colletotrichum salicis]
MFAARCPVSTSPSLPSVDSTYSAQAVSPTLLPTSRSTSRALLRDLVSLLTATTFTALTSTHLSRSQ